LIANDGTRDDGRPLARVAQQLIYAPVSGDQDGTVVGDHIFAAPDGLSVPVGVPPYSTVVVVFPKK
jgi:hypothetical protein